MENVLEIIIPAALCLGGLCYFWYSSKKGKNVIDEKVDGDGELLEYAKSLLAADKLESEALRDLTEHGCKQEDAKRIVAEAVVQLEEKEKKVKRQYMIFGSLFFFGGLIITIWSYIHAVNGGTYIITWGAILFGAILLYKGFDM